MNLTHMDLVISTVESIDEESFTMEQWTNPCRSVGCAIGWTAQTPAAMTSGLKLAELGYPTYFDPATGIKWSAMTGVAKWLDIDRKDAEYLFQEGSYGWQPVSKEHVLTRLKIYRNEHKDSSHG